MALPVFDARTEEGSGIQARFRVPVSDFRSPVSEVRNSGESETRLSESDGGQVYPLCLRALVAT